MKNFLLPGPPFLVGLDWPPAMRRLPIARARFKTAGVVIYAGVNVFWAVAATVGYVFIPGREWLGVVAICSGALALMLIALLAYRWVVACPVCMNGYGPGSRQEWRCEHCDLLIHADESISENNPWGEG